MICVHSPAMCPFLPQREQHKAYIVCFSVGKNRSYFCIVQRSKNYTVVSYMSDILSSGMCAGLEVFIPRGPLLSSPG